MDPREFPTKGNLMLAKNSLALANQGYELMDKKRNILIRELMDLIEEDAGYISVAGLILDKTQGEVQVGTQLDYQGVHFEVIELDGNRIKTVMIRLR